MKKKLDETRNRGWSIANGLNRLTQVAIIACELLATCSALAQTRLPVRFGNEVLWQPRPAYLSNPASRPVVKTSPGSVTLRVDTSVNRTIAGSEMQVLTPHPDWLEARAVAYSARRDEGAMVLSAEPVDRGMKWSMQLNAPLDLGTVRFLSMRYRAKGLAPWNDYCVWLGGRAEGKAVKASAISLSQLRSDGEWRTVVVPLHLKFVANQLALQVSSGQNRGELAIKQMTFSSDRPPIGPGDLLPCCAGHAKSILTPGHFACVELSAIANQAADDVSEEWGVTHWFDPGKLTARGIPFDLPAGRRNLVDSSGVVSPSPAIPIGAAGSEIYVLMGVKLPAVSFAGMLGSTPLDEIDSPERLRFEIHYADGLIDGAFPLALDTNTYQVHNGPDVYCLPNLRKVRIDSIAIRNRMDSSLVAISAVTLNTGRAMARPPVPFGLPAVVQETPSTAAPVHAEIRTTTTGYTVKTRDLEFSLSTSQGITVQSLINHCLKGGEAFLEPGPLFELGTGTHIVASDRLKTGTGTVILNDGNASLKIPFDAGTAGAPFRGSLICTANDPGQITMELELTYTGQKPAETIVNFPTFRGLRLAAATDTWYLWARKGGIISNLPTHQAGYSGGEYPLQVADLFNPRLGGGLALHTFDVAGIYKQWQLDKDGKGVDWRIHYFPVERQPGEAVPVAATSLRAHSGDWRVALRNYREWTRNWYRPATATKRWFQECFNYRQHLAWGGLYDRATGAWRIEEVIRADRDFFGRLDYLHIFDFGESHVYGRVGDYCHYDELGGREGMAAAIAKARQLGVPVGLYIEGYLCDSRAAWGRENVLANDIRTREGKSLLFPGTTSEHMMCPASQKWRDHLARTFQRVAGELQPSGMYIDEFGFMDTWKTCYSREHGHAVPAPPGAGERTTLEAIRAAVPAQIATLTEETPNDLNSQFQDGALGYSVAQANASLSPHRIDLFRFQFPRFKIFQLVSYNNFVEGGWDLLKFPFFNGEGTWLGNAIPEGFSPDAQAFLRKAFAILHEHRDEFCSEDVEPLIPTLDSRVFGNRFTAGTKTALTFYNSGFATFRGEIVKMPHRPGRRYVDAFTGQLLPARIEKGFAYLPLVLGPRSVGCIVVTE